MIGREEVYVNITDTDIRHYNKLYVYRIDNQSDFPYTGPMEPQDLYTEVGNNIRRYRRAVPRTQQEVAARVGLSRASLANIESGHQWVRLHHLYAIAEALQLDSPTVLMPPLKTPPPPARQLAELPLPREGLTDKQRLEVLRLLSDVLGGQEPDTTGGEV